MDIKTSELLNIENLRRPVDSMSCNWSTEVNVRSNKSLKAKWIIAFNLFTVYSQSPVALEKAPLQYAGGENFENLQLNKLNKTQIGFDHIYVKKRKI